MNKLANIFKQPDQGMVEKFKGKGLSILKRSFVSRKERLRKLLEDSDVELLLLMAYNQRGEDLFTGNVCDTGLEVANKVKEVVL